MKFAVRPDGPSGGRILVVRYESLASIAGGAIGLGPSAF